MGSRKDLAIDYRGDVSGSDEYERPRGAIYVLGELADYLIYISLFFYLFGHFYLSSHCLDGILSLNYVLYGTILLPVFLQLLFFMFEVTDDDDSHFPVVGLIRSFWLPAGIRKRAINSRLLKLCISSVFMFFTVVATNLYYLEQFSYDQEAADRPSQLAAVYAQGGTNVVREHLYAWPVISNSVSRERFALLAPTILDNSPKSLKALQFLKKNKVFVRDVISRYLEPNSPFFNLVNLQIYTFQAPLLLNTFPQLKFLPASISRERLESFKWLWLWTLEQQVFGDNPDNLINQKTLGRFLEDNVLLYVPEFLRNSSGQSLAFKTYQKVIAAEENTYKNNLQRSKEFSGIFPLLAYYGWNPATLPQAHKDYAEINNDPLIETMRLTERIWTRTDGQQRIRYFTCGADKSAADSILAYMLNYFKVTSTGCE